MDTSGILNIVGGGLVGYVVKFFVDMNSHSRERKAVRNQVIPMLTQAGAMVLVTNEPGGSFFPGFSQPLEDMITRVVDKDVALAFSRTEMDKLMSLRSLLIVVVALYGMRDSIATNYAVWEKMLLLRCLHVGAEIAEAVKVFEGNLTLSERLSTWAEPFTGKAVDADTGTAPPASQGSSS